VNEAPELVRCPLCGNRFPATRACPESCPMSGNCHTLCCPNCHYRFVETSPLARLLQRILGGERA
jgi:hypothetical protein